ncbi:hypothetical protein Tco_1159349 [Tanacetum coccineum]
MEIDIKNTLKFTEGVQNKVDEMLEIATISYLDNEEFKTLVKYRDERIMNAFKPGKVAEMLDFENLIASDEYYGYYSLCAFSVTRDDHATFLHQHQTWRQLFPHLYRSEK